jgi:hypothetical protein
LEEERANAAAAAAAEEEKTQMDGDAGPNKRSRAEETEQTPIDVTEDDGSVGGNTNDHINDMNMPDALSDEDEEERRGPERSPKKKKEAQRQAIEET